MPFSISAGVGFIALFGIAVLNGIVLIEHLKELMHDHPDYDLDHLIMHGTADRLRPVMLTAAAAAMGFLPMAVSTGAGAEVQRPLATVVIGGLITSTMLTMIALPLLFKLFHDDEGIKYKLVRLFKAKEFVIISFILLSPITASAQEPKSLDDCIRTAIENNRGIQAYRLGIEEKRALANPFIGIDKTKVYYGYDQANMSDNGHPLGVFGIEQTFAFPTVYALTSKANKLEVTIAELELRKQIQLLTRDVSVAYCDLLFLKQKESYFARLDSLYRRLSTMSDTQYRVGDISNLDRLNAQAKQEQIALMRSKTATEVAGAHSRLQAFMQTDEPFTIEEREIPVIPLFQETSLDSLSQIRQGALRTEYLRQSSRVEMHRLLPDITLEYFYGTNRFNPRLPYHGFQIGIGIPLFWGGQTSKAKAYKISAEMNQRMLDNSRIALGAERVRLTGELTKYQKSIDYYSATGKRLSEEISRSATRSYEVGEITFYELVISLENALGLTLDYYEALSGYNRTAIALNYLSIEE